MPQDTKPNKLIVNHEEATQFALMKYEESNLARCYIELRSRIQGIEGAYALNATYAHDNQHKDSENVG